MTTAPSADFPRGYAQLLHDKAEIAEAVTAGMINGLAKIVISAGRHGIVVDAANPLINILAANDGGSPHQYQPLTPLRPHAESPFSAARPAIGPTTGVLPRFDI